MSRFFYEHISNYVIPNNFNSSKSIYNSLYTFLLLYTPDSSSTHDDGHCGTYNSRFVSPTGLLEVFISLLRRMQG